MNSEIVEETFVTKHLNQYGIKEGDICLLKPLSGRKKKINLKYTQVYFVSENLKSSDFPCPTYYLPHQKNESFVVKIGQIQVRTKLNEKYSRYYFEVIEGGVVRLNGNYVYSGILEVGDSLEVSLNDFVFYRHTDDQSHSASLDLHNDFQKMATSKLPILLEGETGVGKTTMAKKIHNESLRRGRFIHLNISSLATNLVESELFGHVKGAFTGAMNDSKGAFKNAHEGTLFIDEIDSLPLDIQTKLLLFLDDCTFTPVGSGQQYVSDTRLIFSSGSKLDHLV